jgi:phytoene desaturase
MRPMAEKSIIIIGAGLAGLATGCYAQMNGYRPQIFEHHTTPGGVATAWKRKGYTIDGGIHFLMGHKPGQALYDELYRELGAAQANRFLDMTIYGRFVDEASGRSVSVTPDMDQLAGDLKAISPADARAIDELIAGVRAMQGADTMGTGMNKPPELMGCSNTSAASSPGPSLITHKLFMTPGCASSLRTCSCQKCRSGSPS